MRACVRASAYRKLNVRTRQDAKGSLRPDASFVQGLSGHLGVKEGGGCLLEEGLFSGTYGTYKHSCHGIL